MGSSSIQFVRLDRLSFELLLLFNMLREKEDGGVEGYCRKSATSITVVLAT